MGENESLAAVPHNWHGVIPVGFHLDCIVRGLYPAEVQVCWLREEHQLLQFWHTEAVQMID